jgi:hypothetical protein
LAICDFCGEFRAGACRLGLNTPKRMACRSFEPHVAGFCADRGDFVSAAQIVGMATHFEMKGAELRKVKAMAALEEKERAAAARAG